MAPTQAFITSYPTRLAKYGNPLYTPVIPTVTVAPTSRTTKRGTTIINYADDAYDDDDFDDNEGQRRPTGLRSLRRDEGHNKDAAIEKLGREIHRPVEVQGIYRDWMTRRTVKPTTDQQVHIQSRLPLTLIPIRIDIDVSPSQRDPPFPLTRTATESGFHPGLPAFQRPEPSPAYKIRDIFLWNLHEALLTPDDFAQIFVRELDLPNPVALTVLISGQIRTQLEEYAGVAMHPLFHHHHTKPSTQTVVAASRPRMNGLPGAVTPGPFLAPPPSRPSSVTPVATTPVQDPPTPLPNGANVAVRASSIPAEAPSDLQMDDQLTQDFDPCLNPDDTYRCIINLTISLSSRLYTDKFEWSLLHPPGLAELFARQTCADLGLNGEWVLAITHAIYEAVLKLKKDAFDGGMLASGGSAWAQGDVDNQAVRSDEGAGWRYDAEDFGSEWEPKVEVLSKDEIEKREGDRERQLRRVRRETAKFSSTSGMMPSTREQEAQHRGSYFDPPSGILGGDNETPNMGRGERSKKKRRFRSLSPVAKAVATPAESATGAGTGWGGAENKLQEYERQNWRCAWCLVWGTGVWAVRDGPAGSRTLCNNCGLLYERDKKLPVWSELLHKHDMPVGRWQRMISQGVLAQGVKKNLRALSGDHNAVVTGQLQPSAQVISNPGHDDMIHDAVLDYYGRRLATCSSDKTIKVFEIDGDKHHLQETLKGHEGAVWCVAWAHPKFGTLLASSSFDGRVHIWRESPGQTPQQPPQWSLVFTSTLHTASVNMVSWSPPDLGCLLACASSDGQVSVLEFRDNHWGNQIFQAHGMGVNAVSWAPSGMPGAIARRDAGGAGTGARRFVTGGSDNQVKVWEFQQQAGNYINTITLPNGHADWVRDVAWSPTLLSKSYIASASQDKTVRIWTSTNPGDPASWQLSKTLEFDAVLWRVSWSLSGNILAVSGGDNKVSLWKENLRGEWEMVREVTE